MDDNKLARLKQIVADSIDFYVFEYSDKKRISAEDKLPDGIAFISKDNIELNVAKDFAQAHIFRIGKKINFYFGRENQKKYWVVDVDGFRP
ncbi:hypothetical protein J4217_02605 [Candidatus Pacearchaeota archaeon]|nr:hypothetical protein [Candidatus Pacearchaeota archaeon]